MSGTHAGPVHPAVPGECVWRWHSDGVDLYCDSRAIPGGDRPECADHLIARIHATPPPVYRRWFGPETT